MGIWENLGMGGYRGFSRPSARLLQQAVQLAGDLGCEQADTSHLLLAMLQQQGAAAQFLTRKNITEPEVRRQLAQQRSGPAQRLDRQSMACLLYTSFTTTGASILPAVEGLPNGILFWRSFTHWIGGMGVLVFLLSLLPLTGGSHVNLMKAESPGPQMCIRDSGLTGQHNGRGTVVDGVCHVRDLGAGGAGVHDHAVQHLSSGDDGLAEGEGAVDDGLLDAGQLGEVDLHAQIATGHHHGIGSSQNAVDVVHALAVLDLCNDADVGIVLVQQIADIVHVLCGCLLYTSRCV